MEFTHLPRKKLLFPDPFAPTRDRNTSTVRLLLDNLRVDSNRE